MNNPYPVQRLENRLKHSFSLVDHILITCDFFETHLNIILVQEGEDLDQMRRLKYTPSQMIVQWMRKMLLDDAGGVIADLFSGVKSVFDLREELPRLDPAALEKRAREVCAPRKDSEYYDEIMSYSTLKLWYACVGTLGVGVDGFASVYYDDSADVSPSTGDDIVYDDSNSQN